MLQGEKARITVNLDIPGSRIMAAAELVMEQYKPIVEEALKEVVAGFNTNDLIKQSVKDTVKKDVKHVIEDTLNKIVERIVTEQFYKNWDNISDKVREIINQQFENHG